jgi:hypothetical protein
MNKNFVCLTVYDRYENLERWLHCWNKSVHHDFELVVIHNTDSEQQQYKSLCEYHKVKYIQRHNVGFDIGAFQDVCLERLNGFDNNWDKLLWIVDDWFPMDKNFIKQYVNHFKKDITEVVCTEISDEYKRHIRTSGFLISKSTSKRLNFDVEQVVSKEDCYNFEHRSNNAFYEQVVNMGIKVELVAPLHLAPLWDVNARPHLMRMDEHNNVFYSSNKVIVLAPIYNSYPQIVSSMITQTHQDWELYLVQDGNEDKKIGEYVKFVNDSRVKYFESEERIGNYGHPIRKEYLKKFADIDADYIVITNGDNYHTPNYLETLIKGFDSNTIATYCDTMSHSYIQWKIINCRLELGYLDCAGVMVRKDAACSVGWNDTDTHSSDWKYFQDISNVYGWHKFKKVEGCLLIHN